MENKSSYIALPVLINLVAVFALSCFAGINGYSLESFAIEHPIPSASFFFMGVVFGWLALSLTRFGQIRCKESVEKAQLQDRISRQDDEINDLRAQVSQYEAEKRFRKSDDDILKQVVATYVREKTWEETIK